MKKHLLICFLIALCIGCAQQSPELKSAPDIKPFNKESQVGNFINWPIGLRDAIDKKYGISRPGC